MAESHTATSNSSSEERKIISSSFGESTNKRSLQGNSNDGIKIAGILDLTNFDWAETIFEVTIDLLRDPNNGFFDEIFDPYLSSLREDTPISFEVLDGACDGHKALSSYWKTKPVQALIGARCSGASIPLGWMGGFDNVPQISMSSTSARLSDKSEFPNFSRVVSPDDERGQVGALVSTLGLFNWDRVTIINTDTSYAKDLATSFQRIWRGEVAYTGNIEMLPDGTIDQSSARKILESAPHKDPVNNSKVVVLLAHSQHAIPILELARNYYPKDTYWVGSESWTGEKSNEIGRLGIGHLGVVPFRLKPENNQVYSKFLELGGSRLTPILSNDLQQRSPSTAPSSLSNDLQQRSPSTLPDYASEYTVDAIVAMFKALSATPMELWNDGDAVTKKLRELEFEGLSGKVSFTSEGDRKEPMFTIMNLQSDGGSFEWVEVGRTQNFEGSASFGDYGLRGVCFAGAGCGLDAAPDDSPPIPVDKLRIWAPLVIVFLCLFFYRYRSKKIEASRKTKAILAAKEAELNDFKNSVVNMCAAEEQYVPKLSASSLTFEDSSSFALPPPSPLTSLPPPPTITWCWKEHDGHMHKWRDDEIEGNRADRWIKYDCPLYIESVYNRQGGSGIFKLNSNYIINFATWTQTNNDTNFQREVKRVVKHLQQEQSPNNTKRAPSAIDFSSIARFAGSPPSKIAKEPQMVLVPGDIVQISKKRKDNWAYGSKLHLEDEPLGRRLVLLALLTCDTQSSSSTKKIGDGDGDEDNKVIITNNHGWFPMAVTRAPDTNDLATLRKTLGDAGDLSAPDTWDKIVDPSVVQKSAPLNPSSKEYREVSNSFLMTLPKTTKIMRIYRIQNMAMYQSYIVKRKTIVDRDKTLTEKQALARFERRWLWHGTNEDSVEKIIQQGFNRSFCGKNATVYGKGVYFARDASYSAADLYSPKDAKGNKYILACSVVVGEFCTGKRDARTPDLRNATKNILYDSTVDNETRPSLYVTYHDAQCYPDYMIVFKN